MSLKVDDAPGTIAYRHKNSCAHEKVYVATPGCLSLPSNHDLDALTTDVAVLKAGGGVLADGDKKPFGAVTSQRVKKGQAIIQKGFDAT